MQIASEAQHRTYADWWPRDGHRQPTMGGQGGAKKKAKGAPAVASSSKAAAKPAPVARKRAAPEPAEAVVPEAAKPVIKKKKSATAAAGASDGAAGASAAAPVKAKKAKKAPAHIPLEAEPSQSAEPVEPLSKKEKDLQQRREARKPVGFGETTGPGSTIVYLGHIPHGFYEEQMRGFFSQFGTLGRVRLVRNKKVRCPPEARARMHPTSPARRRGPPTRCRSHGNRARLQTGKSKHFAFLEFKHLEVAEIVVKAMNGYLLYSKILVCKILKETDVPPKVFNARPINPDKPFDWLSAERKRHNEPPTEEQEQKRAKKQGQRDTKRSKAWAELGIEYEFSRPSAAEAPAETSADPSPAASKPKKAGSAAAKRPVDDVDAAPVKKAAKKAAAKVDADEDSDAAAPPKKATSKKASTPTAATPKAVVKKVAKRPKSAA